MSAERCGARGRGTPSVLTLVWRRRRGGARPSVGHSAVRAMDGRARARALAPEGIGAEVAAFRVLPVVPGGYVLRFTRDRRNFATYRP
eukprot:6484816-Prymnesium_polylepis.1